MNLLFLLQARDCNAKYWNSYFNFLVFTAGDINLTKHNSSEHSVAQDTYPFASVSEDTMN